MCSEKKKKKRERKLQIDNSVSLEIKKVLKVLLNPHPSKLILNGFESNIITRFKIECSSV